VKVAEANFAQLAAYMKLNKMMAHLVIDVIMGNVTDLKGIVSGALSEGFDDNVAGVFDGIVDPNSLGGNFGSSLGNRGAAEILDFNNKLEVTAGKIADKLKLTGIRKASFIQSVKDRFSDSPSDLIDPSAWVKLIYDVVVNEGGAAAENFVNSVKKMRAKRDANLLEAWKTAQLLKQINNVLKKVRSEECMKACISGLESEVKKREEEKKKYKEKIKADSTAVLKALEWILDYRMEFMVGDNPSDKDVRAKLLAELKKQLCKHGIDLCWVDIEFDVSFSKLKGGGIKWEIKNYRLKKRKTRKDPCGCEVVKNNDGGSGLTVDSDLNSGTGSTTDLGGESGVDETVEDGDKEVDECFGFMPESYMGDVSFETGRFIAVEFENCGGGDVPEPVVHDRFLSLFGVEGDELFMRFMDPVNDGVLFNMESGEFMRDGVVVELEEWGRQP